MELVTLSVGGFLFTCLRQTLASRPGTLLSGMFSGAMQPGALDDEGHVFIDRDPTHFRSILAFMRDGTAPVPPDPAARRELRAEAEYFGCWQLVADIDAVEARHGHLETAREQKLLAEALLLHEMANVYREADATAETAGAEAAAAKTRLAELRGTMADARFQAAAAHHQLHGMELPPATRLAQRQCFHSAACRWHAASEQYNQAAAAWTQFVQTQRAAQLRRLVALNISQHAEEILGSQPEAPEKLRAEQPIPMSAPPPDFEQWAAEEDRRDAAVAARAAANAEAAAGAQQAGGLRGDWPFWMNAEGLAGMLGGLGPPDGAAIAGVAGQNLRIMQMVRQQQQQQQMQRLQRLEQVLAANPVPAPAAVGGADFLRRLAAQPAAAVAAQRAPPAPPAAAAAALAARLAHEERPVLLDAMRRQMGIARVPHQPPLRVVDSDDEDDGLPELLMDDEDEGPYAEHDRRIARMLARAERAVALMGQGRRHDAGRGPVAAAAAAGALPQQDAAPGQDNVGRLVDLVHGRGGWQERLARLQGLRRDNAGLAAAPAAQPEGPLLQQAAAGAGQGPLAAPAVAVAAGLAAAIAAAGGAQQAALPAEDAGGHGPAPPPAAPLALRRVVRMRRAARQEAREQVQEAARARILSPNLARQLQRHQAADKPVQPVAQRASPRRQGQEQQE